MGEYRIPMTVTLTATLLAWGAWVFAVFMTNPETGVVAHLAFYGTFLAGVAGTATLLGLFVRRSAPDRSRAIRIAIRQGALIGIAIAVAVLLQSRELFTWVNALALIAMLTLFELFLISLRSAPPPHDGGVAAE